MDTVELLRWPLDADLRELERTPARLLLLMAGEIPPVLGPHEDFVYLPCDERDLSARVQRLASRVTAPAPLVAGEVVVGLGGRVTRGGNRVFLPPNEAVIMATLGAAPEQVVTRGDLAEAIWADRSRVGRALDARVYSLRGRLDPLGLVIHTIRGRGFMLSSGGSALSTQAPHGRTRRTHGA